MLHQIEYADTEYCEDDISADQQRGAKILLVDDDRDLVETLAIGLRRAGFKPETAFSAHAAIAQFERERPDAVVLDIQLGPSSGLSLLDELRGRTEVPILVLTGTVSESVEAQSFELGADDFLHKPVSTHSLIVRLRALLRRSSRMRQEAEIQAQLSAGLRELAEARAVALLEARQLARAHNEKIASVIQNLLDSLTVIKSITQPARQKSIRSDSHEAGPTSQAFTLIDLRASDMISRLTYLMDTTRLETARELEGIEGGVCSPVPQNSH